MFNPSKLKGVTISTIGEAVSFCCENEAELDILPELDDLHEDALWDNELLESLDTLDGGETEDPLRTAGIDERTPVDTFLNMQGETSFVTKL